MQKIQKFLIAATSVLWIGAGVAQAQEPPSAAVERLGRMEARLDSLQKESDALRGEIEVLKRDLGTAEPVAEDLTAIDLAASPSVSPPADAPAHPVELIRNPAANAGKVFNPDIAVIGNFLGKAGDPNPFEERASLAMEESEISFQAFVDPYAQAKFFVAVSPEGAALEEGFINFIALPHDLTARVGKLKSSFGKENLMHAHIRPWIDRPLVTTTFFGDEGLADSGVSVSRILPTGSGLFVEATGEVYAGDVDGVFESANANDLFYLAHLKAYRDLSEQTNLEVGASFARGTLPGTGGSNEFAGLDVTLRYKPLQRALYRSFISRTELMSNHRAGSDSAFGFYTSLDYQFARRWYAGVRLDRSEHPDDPAIRDRGASVLLTFWPSEFSQLRAQARRTRFGNEPWITELLMQVQFSIGAHGAHAF